MDNQLHKHTVSSFDKELTSIANFMESMGNFVIDSINILLSNITKPAEGSAEETAQKVRGIDEKVNELEKEIQALSTNLIALRNPLAVDLRYLIGSIKISTIVERQGDMIENAVRKTLKIDKKILLAYKDELTELATSNIEMIKLSIAGFKTQDVKEANKVWRIEDRVDDLSDALFDKIKADIQKTPADVDSYVSLMLVVRGLERTADYCTNITKAVHYISTGERVSEKDF